MFAKLADLLETLDCCDSSIFDLINSEKFEKLVIKVFKIIENVIKNPYRVLEHANSLRAERCGDIVTFVVNRNVNFTDFCVNRCKFCSFRNNRGYLLSLEEVEKKVREAVGYGCTEVCLQGGLMPGADVDFYVSLLKTVRKVSKNIHIHAFSPMEVLHASRNSECCVEETLREFKKAGLNSMPGTAAEIFDDRIRKEICPEKLSVARWFEVVSIAHELGIPTTATMMYGHVESWKERIKHMLLLRKLQVETSGFTEFIPLTFLWRNNDLGRRVKGCSGFEDLLVIAVSRIVLDDAINNIQASWVKFGVKLAQAALFAGANDLGGTLMEENISRAAGSDSGEFLRIEEFVELIKGCNRTPAERDTLYNILRIFR